MNANGAVRKLLGRGSIYTLVLGVQMASALLVVPVVTRLLSSSAYGRVAAGLVVVNLLSIVGTIGLPEGASRAYFHGPDGPCHARQLVAATLVTGAVAGLVAELTGHLWAPLLGMDYSAVLRYAVWGGVAMAVAIAAQTFLRAADRAWAFFAIAAVMTVGGQGLGLGLTFAFGTPAAYMAGLAAGSVASAVVALVLSGALGHGLPRRPVLRTALGIGVPMVPHSLSVYLLVSADRVVIAAAMGLAAVGRYQVAYTVGAVGVALITALNQAWLPLLLGADEDERWEVVAQTSRAVHRLCLVAGGLLALAAPLALMVAAPPSYDRDALVPISAVVAFSVLPGATSSSFLNAMFVLGRTRIMLVATPLAVALNIGMNAALLPLIGLIGAAFATVAGYVVVALVAIVGTRRTVQVPGLTAASLREWAIAVPFIAAGALLPYDQAGAALRATLGVGLVLFGARALAALWSADSRPVHAFAATGVS